MYKPQVNPLLQKAKPSKVLSHGHFGISTTGKIHRVLGPMAAACSSSNRGLRNRRIDDEYAMAQDASQFCNKCFPNGKPE